LDHVNLEAEKCKTEHLKLEIKDKHKILNRTSLKLNKTEQV